MKKRFRKRWTLRVVILTVVGAMWSVAASDAQTQSRVWTTARPTNIETDLNCVFFVDAKRGWAAGDDGVVLSTTDGGVTWQRNRLGAGEAINDVYFRNKDDGLALAGARIWQSSDGGRSWREATRFAENYFGAAPELYSVQFVNRRTGFIVGSLVRGESVVDSLMIKTTDGGATWTRVTLPVRAELIDLDFEGERRGFVVGANGTILATTDGGETWTAQKSNTNVALYNVDARGEKALVVGEGGMILSTTNGGTAWEAIRSPVRSTLLNVKLANANEAFAVGRNGVILRSDNGGRSWTRENSETREHFYALFVRDKRGWAVGGKGVVAQYER